MRSRDQAIEPLGHLIKTPKEPQQQALRVSVEPLRNFILNPSGTSKEPYHRPFKEPHPKPFKNLARTLRNPQPPPSQGTSPRTPRNPPTPPLNSTPLSRNLTRTPRNPTPPTLSRNLRNPTNPLSRNSTPPLKEPHQNPF
nr:uncharacterized protein LOC113828678 [Penaeus vannamei]